VGDTDVEGLTWKGKEKKLVWVEKGKVEKKDRRVSEMKFWEKECLEDRKRRGSHSSVPRSSLFTQN